MKNLPFSRLALLLFALVSSLFNFSVQAETVQLVKDINQRSDWKIQRSLSNGRVAFHFRLQSDNGPFTLFRSTESATTQIDLTVFPLESYERYSVKAFLTENYLYSPVINIPNDYEFLGWWQLNIDTLEGRLVRELGGIDPQFGSAPFWDSETDNIYKFVSERSGGMRLARLNEQAAVLKPVGRSVPEESLNGKSFVLGDHIVFEGRNSMWRIGKSGDNPIKLASVRASSQGGGAAVGKSLAYFSVEQRSTSPQPYRCSLWRTDGTRTGTRWLSKLVVGTPRPDDYYTLMDDACNPETVIVSGNRALFKKVNFNTGFIELWETRGSKATTRLRKRLPLADLPTEANPDPTLVDLRVLNASVWYKMYNRNEKPVVFVGDASLRSFRPVIAGRKHGLIDLIPISNHMLVQVDNDRVHSKLFKVDAAGNNLSRLYYGREYLDDATNISAYDYTGDVVSLGSQILFPYKTVARKRELLVSHDLSTNANAVRRRWEDTTAGSDRADRIFPGPDGTAYICASDGMASRGLEWLNRPGFWRSDGTEANTTEIVSNVFNPSTRLESVEQTDCGPLAFSGDKLYFARNQLWQANLDGSDQTIFIDLSPGEVSDDPKQIVGLSDGVVFSMVPDAADPSSGSKILLRAYQNGRSEVLAEGAKIEILAQTGDRVLFRKYLDSNFEYSLWLTDGTVASTTEVDDTARNYFDETVGLIELNGDIYYGITRTSISKWRIYKVPRGSAQAEAVTDWISGELSQIAVFSNEIHVLRDADFLERGQLARLNTNTGDLTTIADSESVGTSGDIRSFAVLNNQIYFYISNRNFNRREINWQIWRSSGTPGDAVKVFEETLPQSSFAIAFPEREGDLTATSRSIYFLSSGRSAGTELWQLKP